MGERLLDGLLRVKPEDFFRETVIDHQRGRIEVMSREGDECFSVFTCAHAELVPPEGRRQ